LRDHNVVIIYHLLLGLLESHTPETIRWTHLGAASGGTGQFN